MIRPSTLLGGRVQHAQAADGHRTSLEPVLLAASVPARPGARVLEAGSGAGTALLCLAHRVPDLCGVGIEVNPDQVSIARGNAAANGFSGLRFLTGDITTALPAETFDHAITNPPWHDAAGTRSDDLAQETARRAMPGLFTGWIRLLATRLRHHGTLSVIVATPALPECLAALPAAGCGSPAILPLWPKHGRAAKLVILRAVRNGRGPCQILPGLVLHQQDGGFTDAAQAILRDGAALEF